MAGCRDLVEKVNLQKLQILAIDVGAGTQDIVLYESGRPVENCPKLVLPSQTQIAAGRVRAATAAGRRLHLTGTLMGGRESGYAVRDHPAAGLRVTANPSAARTVHNDLARVEAMGVELREDPPDGAVVVELTGIDLDALREALARFEIEMPEIVAVAAQDHGDAAIYDRIKPPTPTPSTGTSGAADSVPNRVLFVSGSGERLGSPTRRLG